MRQRVVQVARHAQALAHHGGLARLLRQPADLDRALAHALVELGIEQAQLVALALQRVEQPVERGAQARGLVGALGHLDARGAAGEHRVGRARDHAHAMGQAVRHGHADHRGAQAQHAEHQRDAPFDGGRERGQRGHRLHHHHAPAQAPQGAVALGAWRRHQEGLVVDQPPHPDARRQVGAIGAQPGDRRVEGRGQVAPLAPARAEQGRRAVAHHAVAVDQQPLAGRGLDAGHRVVHPLPAELRRHHADDGAVGVAHRRAELEEVLARRAALLDPRIGQPLRDPRMLVDVLAHHLRVGGRDDETVRVGQRQPDQVRHAAVHRLERALPPRGVVALHVLRQDRGHHAHRLQAQQHRGVELGADVLAGRLQPLRVHLEQGRAHEAAQPEVGRQRQADGQRDHQPADRSGEAASGVDALQQAHREVEAGGAGGGRAVMGGALSQRTRGASAHDFRYGHLP